MVSLIIVDYNSIEKTLKFIDDFLSNVNDQTVFCPVIIDNYEKHNSIDILISKYGNHITHRLEIYGSTKLVDVFFDGTKKIIYYYAGNNLGYAKGNNIGVEISNQLIQSKYYLISNNDLRLVSSFDFAIIKRIFDSNDKIAVIGPKIIDKKGNNQSPRKKVSVFKKLFLYCWYSTWPFRKDIDLGNYEKSGPCYWVSGAFLFIRANSFMESGGFDEGTFLFGEEMILSERLKRHGYCMYFYKDMTVIHEHGSSVKNNHSSSVSEEWSLRSTQYYCKKYRNTPKFVIDLSNYNFKIYQLVKKIRQKMVKK